MANVLTYLYVAMQCRENWPALRINGRLFIEGTPLFAAVSVLEGGGHTRSSMYEGLFYSLLYICRRGQLPDEWAFRFSQEAWAKVRRGYMMCEPPVDTWGVPVGVAPLIRGLHALFWQQDRLGGVRYRTDVTREEVQHVCTNFAS